ncbi:ABC transporter substrate-binding protein [Paraglaciecola chathamensis]|uniref:ABC transporter substrate-binding protein n=1 Tax=Paraglaciecola chathamensis TaxID=368405 RepID=UPI0026FF6057|nr:ABC transporter substrate-binding protein [Paraglaciecola chathamensis]MDO6558497.1 ABC transporter substrate-binding protein [Paraglaciecola chathamensis]
MKSNYLVVFAFLFMLLVACSPQAPEKTHSRKAQNNGVSDSKQKGQQRIIVIGSTLAEIVVALGATDRVVGVGAGTEHIRELENVPVIPGYRNTSSENMLALAPTVALFAGRQAAPGLVDQLELSGVKVHLFADDARNIEAVPENIERVGAILGTQNRATKLNEHFKQELHYALAKVEKVTAKITNKPKGLFILSGGGRPTLVAGGNTDIALIIEMAGGLNMTRDIQHFKPMSQEKMLEAAPEFILINKEGKQISGGLPVALTAPGVQLTPAGKNQNIITLPSGYLVGLGLSTPKAILALARQIYPNFDVNAALVE